MLSLCLAATLFFHVGVEVSVKSNYGTIVCWRSQACFAVRVLLSSPRYIQSLYDVTLHI